eukprot:5294183-Prymnesium_polylepis.2
MHCSRCGGGRALSGGILKVFARATVSLTNLQLYLSCGSGPLGSVTEARCEVSHDTHTPHGLISPPRVQP